MTGRRVLPVARQQFTADSSGALAWCDTDGSVFVSGALDHIGHELICSKLPTGTVVFSYRGFRFGVLCAFVGQQFFIFRFDGSPLPCAEPCHKVTGAVWRG